MDSEQFWSQSRGIWIDWCPPLQVRLVHKMMLAEELQRMRAVQQQRLLASSVQGPGGCRLSMRRLCVNRQQVQWGMRHGHCRGMRLLNLQAPDKP